MKTALVNRNKIIRDTSILGIVANLLIAGVKVVLGVLTSSVAIVSEGANNAGDVLTSGRRIRPRLRRWASTAATTRSARRSPSSRA